MMKSNSQVKTKYCHCLKMLNTSKSRISYMNNILVTGGAGYIGSHVCHLLVDNGYNVTCIDSLITGNKKLIPKEVELNIFDIDLAN